jgi:hypothetical protein
MAFSILLVLLMLSAIGFSIYKARGGTDHS